jgi:hypothetical protein
VVRLPSRLDWESDEGTGSRINVVKAKAKFNLAIGRLVGTVCLCATLTGCLTHYDVTLGNGNVVRAKNKPKLNEQGYYVFKDLSGQEVTVNKMRVRQIEPVRRGSRPSSSFLDPVR